jgi:hypothetical protein
MQIAMAADDLRPRSEHQMEGVAQDLLGARRLELFRGHRLDRAVGPDRHESRRVHLTPGKAQASASRRPIGGKQIELHP